MHGERIRILHVINSLAIGGAEMMLYKLLARTSRKKFEPVVVSLMQRGALSDAIESLGIPVHYVGMRPAMPNPLALWRLGVLVRRFRPDLIQGWLSHGNLAALIGSAATVRGVPVVWNVRQSVYPSKYDKPMTAVVAKLCVRFSALPSRIVYNSETSAEQHVMIGYPSNRMAVVPNGFDIERFVPSEAARSDVRMELSVEQDTILIGLVGSFGVLKDHANFFNAAALLANHPNVHFVLSGRGVHRDNTALTRLFEGRGISERVHLLSERHDMPRLAAAMDIATSSSCSEGFSNVIGEAMACGVPCVATDVGDSARIIGDTGLIVPKQNPSALCDAWLKLIQAGPVARRELGMRARDRIKEKFAIQRIVNEYETIYGEILRGC
jgi:glycosyltransferase involved in cell wall biosynthesis